MQDFIHKILPSQTHCLAKKAPHAVYLRYMQFTCENR